MALPRALSQTQAAHRLDVHPVTLNRIENGKANVSLELLERMCALYGCTRPFLLGEPEQVDPFDAAKAQVAAALGEISDGFEKLADVVEALNEQAREAAAGQKVAA